MLQRLGSFTSRSQCSWCAGLIALSMKDDLVAEMLKQAIPGAAAERFKEEVLGTCMRQLEYVRQIATFKQSDFA